MISYVKVKKQVYAEIDVRAMNNTKMYNFVLQLMNNDHEQTKSFLINEGYTTGEINQVLRNKESTRYLNI